MHSIQRSQRCSGGSGPPRRPPRWIGCPRFERGRSIQVLRSYLVLSIVNLRDRCLFEIGCRGFGSGSNRICECQAPIHRRDCAGKRSEAIYWRKLPINCFGLGCCEAHFQDSKPCLEERLFAKCNYLCLKGLTCRGAQFEASRSETVDSNSD